MTETLFKGLVHVTGEHDTGKTTFALEAGPTPEKIVIFDHDLKADSVVKQMKAAGSPFAQYHDLVRLNADKVELEFHEACLKLIDQIPQGTQLVIWDNWTPFENTHHPYVEAFPAKFRKRWSPMGRIKGAQMWQESYEYAAQIINRILARTDMFILTTHLKAYYLNNVDTGKKIPACKKVIEEKSLLRVWLRHNPFDARPSGVILKRIGRPEITEEGIKITNILPRRMPICTWQEIRRFWKEPFDDSIRDEEFIPSRDELALIEGVLTPDNIKIYEAGVKALELIPPEEEEEEGAEEAESEIILALRAVLDEAPDLAVPKIRKKLAENGHEISVPDLSELLVTIRQGQESE